MIPISSRIRVDDHAIVIINLANERLSPMQEARSNVSNARMGLSVLMGLDSCESAWFAWCCCCCCARDHSRLISQLSVGPTATMSRTNVPVSPRIQVRLLHDGGGGGGTKSLWFCARDRARSNQLRPIVNDIFVVGHTESIKMSVHILTIVSNLLAQHRRF